MPEVNRVIRDTSGVPVGMAPLGIATVVKDLPIPHRAVRSDQDLVVYFNDDTETTWTFESGEIIAVSPAMRLAVSAVCLVY